MHDVDATVRRPSSPLGFGCAGLSLADPAAHHDALLGTAWDQGVRWYDVARSYSYGAAEEILGRFLRGRRDEAVVVSKFGIRPPAAVGRSRLLRNAARAAFAVAPGLKRHVTRSADRATSSGDFSVGAATSSLEASLRALGTDRLDALLLHEVSPAAVTEELHDWLEGQRSRGTILGWGTATSTVADTAAVLHAHPWAAGPVVQVQDSVDGELSNQVGGRDRLVVLHSVVAPRLARLRTLLDEQPGLVQRVREQAGVDLSDRSAIGPLLLSAAVARQPDGMVLFSSRDLDRCRASARAVADVPPEEALATFAVLDTH